MNYPIDYKDLMTTAEFYSDVIKMHQEATAYLLDFTWCKKIIKASIYLNLGSTLCIFLFKIENTASNDDDYLWVIAGDLPPMYLDIHGPKTIRKVLKDYIRLAEDWVEHVKLGKSIRDCYPFKSEPTLEMATLLEKRTSFMKERLMDNIADISLQINK